MLLTITLRRTHKTIYLESQSQKEHLFFREHLESYNRSISLLLGLLGSTEVYFSQILAIT